jgi:hypothetical protein
MFNVISQSDRIKTCVAESTDLIFVL